MTDSSSNGTTTGTWPWPPRGASSSPTNRPTTRPRRHGPRRLPEPVVAAAHPAQLGRARSDTWPSDASSTCCSTSASSSSPVTSMHALRSACRRRYCSSIAPITADRSSCTSRARTPIWRRRRRLRPRWTSAGRRYTRWSPAPWPARRSRSCVRRRSGPRTGTRRFVLTLPRGSAEASTTTIATQAEEHERLVGQLVERIASGDRAGGHRGRGGPSVRPGPERRGSQDLRAGQQGGVTRRSPGATFAVALTCTRA